MPLVLTRKRHERVLLALPGGQKIWVEVVDAHGGSARLSIDAPASVRICREEILDPAECWRPLPARKAVAP